MRAVAESCKIEMKVLMEKLIWPLQRQYKEHHVLEALYNSLQDFEGVFGQFFNDQNPELDDKVKSKLKSELERRLSPQPIKIRADFEVTCFEVEGIEGIREALLAGESVSTEKIKLGVNLIAPPTYVISTNTLFKNDAFE